MDPEVISHYYVLDVEYDARDAQIKRGYRSQCIIWHPDKNIGVSTQRAFECTAMMQKLNEAYVCLLDPVARKTYELKCASMIFTHDSDPGNFFRRQYESQRRAREEAAQRRRDEERERNAARQRQQQDQERRRRESEERERQQREREEQQQRAERERDAEEDRERSRREEAAREHRTREPEQEQRRQSAPEHQAGTAYSNHSTSSNFASQEWETFFNLLRILIKLHELVSDNRHPRSDNSYTRPESNPSHSSPPSSNASPNSSRFAQEHAETGSRFTAGSAASTNIPKQNKTSSEFGPVPGYSSRARWSATELEALLKLRKNYPYESWDIIASRLNATFKNGRNGNAVRQKHNKSVK